MEISAQAVEEFKRLYREELGKVLDDSVACYEAMRFLSLAQVLTEPVNSDRDAAFIEGLRLAGRKKGRNVESIDQLKRLEGGAMKDKLI